MSHEPDCGEMALLSRRVAYFDCFCGISGDMILGALLDTGLEIEQLHQTLALLGLEGYALAARPVVKGTIGGMAASVEVLQNEQAPRHLADVLAIIDRSGLDAAVKARAGLVFRRLAEAEARVHRVDVAAIHFHTVRPEPSHVRSRRVPRRDARSR